LTRGGDIRVALIGYGYAAKTFHAPLVASAPGLALQVVASSDAAKVHADLPGVRVVATPAAVWADRTIDLVVIATPNDTHFSLAAAALESGKHVVVDKPFTISVAEARELAALATRADRLLSVFHNRRYDADFLTVRRLLAGGALGRLVSFESRFDRFRPAVRERWRESATPGAGLWYDLGPHLVDQTLQLFGYPQSVYADFATLRDRARAVDYFHVLLAYERLRVVLHASTLAAEAGARFALHGTSGSYVKRGLDVQEDALKAGRLPNEAGFGDDPEAGVLTHFDGSVRVTERIANERGDYGRYYAGIRDALTAAGPNPVPVDQAIDVVRVIEQGLTSEAATERTAR
jgi:predicted dehydrogenase